MVIRKIRKTFIAIFLALLSLSLNAQEKQKIVDYMNVEDYIIGGVTVTGVRFLDTNALIGISGLRVGQKVAIPGDAITTAVTKIMAAGTFFRCQNNNYQKSAQILLILILIYRKDQGYHQ